MEARFHLLVRAAIIRPSVVRAHIRAASNAAEVCIFAGMLGRLITRGEIELLDLFSQARALRVATRLPREVEDILSERISIQENRWFLHPQPVPKGRAEVANCVLEASTRFDQTPTGSDN